MEEKNIIITMKSDEHMISGDTKKHKLSLMIACSIVISVCYFNESKIKSIFGVIQFEEAIPSTKIIIPLLFIMIYQAWLYRCLLLDSLKSHEEKIREKLEKKHFRFLNNLDKYLINIHKVDEYKKEKNINIENLSMSFKKIQELKGSIGIDSISDYSREYYKDFDRETFMDWIQRYHDLLVEAEIIRKRHDELREKSHDCTVIYGNPHSNEAEKELSKMLNIIQYHFRTTHAISKISETSWAIHEFLKELEENTLIFSDKVNDYHHLYNVHLERSMRIRESILLKIQERRVDERKNLLIYQYLPFSYFLFSLMYAAHTLSMDYESYENFISSLINTLRVYIYPYLI
ncbi:TPA: hypothetical protein I7282_02725 [Vibrio parahaemolyticus]|nr:hypothetical protein [Vibrio parahaemolyticus]